VPAFTRENHEAMRMQSVVRDGVVVFAFIVLLANVASHPASGTQTGGALTTYAGGCALRHGLLNTSTLPCTNSNELLPTCLVWQSRRAIFIWDIPLS